MRNGPAARSFGGCRGGSVSASPQRAVLAEPTQATAKRTVEGLFPIFRQALNGVSMGKVITRLTRECGIEHPIPLQTFSKIRACLQNGFGADLELIVVKTRREKGAYSLKSVTDEQQRPDRHQPEDAPKSILKTRPGMIFVTKRFWQCLILQRNR